jgi:hypothetical protein
MLMISIHFLDVCPINGPDSQTTNTPFSYVAGNSILKVSVLCNYTLGTRGRFFKVKVVLNHGGGLRETWGSR